MNDDDELIDVGKRQKKIFRKWERLGEKRKFFLVRPYTLWPAREDEIKQIKDKCISLGYSVQKDTFGPPGDFAVYAWNKNNPDLPRIAVISQKVGLSHSSFTRGIDPSTQVDKKVPKTVEFVGKRILRDTKASKDLKEFYDYTCQICGTRLYNGHTEKYYSEVHHVRPLGVGSPMVDDWSNMICLCPNHHAEMDYCMLYIDPESKIIVHSNKQDPINGATLTIWDGHGLDPEFLNYHKIILCKDWSG